ncbi:MAG TPA: ABC transporter permease subunit [Phototrophicaceae bacterium]|nr:ABC transporter permease subunit [Phototrophicaceae bacterium]
MATLPRKDSVFNSRRGRALQENLTAYVFLAPALLLIFVFGIFPVAFAFFVSLHQWRRFPGDYLGLDNYVRALDSFAYVLFFWLALGALVYALALLRRLWLRNDERLRALAFLIPGVVNAAAILLWINWVAILLPLIINIPQQIRTQTRSLALFVNALVACFQDPTATAAGNQFLAALIAGIVLSVIALLVLRSAQRGLYLFQASSAIFSAAIGVLLLQLTINAVQDAANAAKTAGGALPLWSMIIIISAGVALIAAGYVIWQRALKQEAGNRRFITLTLAAILLACGGAALVVDLPRALTNSDGKVLAGFNITIMFAIGTVPFQLAIGLGLAFLLFQNIKAKSFFRVVYFLPYIMPFVATSIVFGLIFSFRPSSIANNMLQFVGVPPQKWLTDPTGVFTLIFGPQLPSFLTGPSIALLVIMIYTTWTYIGYDAVIFLAGLGGVPVELYEAARIDGASGWSVFRYITLPLLSPTTFFLSLIAVIGTFQAFTQIWLMRTPAAASSVDTVGVYIYTTVQSNDPNLGYGSAVALVLFGVILLLTIFQNRIIGSRVFYG